MPEPIYDESTIKSLDWKEHIRTRPGMYIGKLGDGSSHDDGIYILLKEVMDNGIDEFIMGHGKTIEIRVSDHKVTVRDYGRGIPLGKVIDCVSKINTGGKYDTAAFQKSVGLNGVGTKAVNALSEVFTVQSIRDFKMKEVEYSRGSIIKDHKIDKTTTRNGTRVVFKPDKDIFKQRKLEIETECPMYSEIYNKLRPMPTEGVFHLDGKPGFGLEISTDLLDAYTVDRVIVKTSG